MSELGPDTDRVTKPSTGSAHPLLGSRSMPSHRVLAAVLPELIGEIIDRQLDIESRMSAATKPEGALRRASRTGHDVHAPRVSTPVPVAVMLDDDVEYTRLTRLSAEDIDALGVDARIAAVNAAAQSLGIYRGQAIGKASAAVPRLQLVRLSSSALTEALAGLSDVVRRHGALVSYAAPDTLWIDVSAVARTAGDEAAIAEETLSALTRSGHYTRVAVGDGPWLAQACARFGDLDGGGARVVSSAETRAALLGLPIIALPLEPSICAQLTQRGALTIGDLRALGSSALVEQLLTPAARTGRRAARGPTTKSHRQDRLPSSQRRCATEVLELVRGRDRRVLEAQPPSALRERVGWEQATSDARALDVALSAACTRIAQRLAGRLEAVLELSLTARAENEEPRKIPMRFRAPLWSSEELHRAVRRGLRELAGVRVRELTLEVVRTAPAPGTQKCLAFVELGETEPDPTALTRLLEQLAERVDASALGFRSPAQRPREATAETEQQRGLPRLSSPNGAAWSQGVPTRWLSSPVSLGSGVRRGQIVVLESQAYVIRSRRLEGRREERQGQRSVVRDYYKVWLAALDESALSEPPALAATRKGTVRHGVEALVVRDARGAHVQALFD